MKKTLKDNGLGLAFGLLFLATLVAQSFAGWQEFNTQQASEGLVQLSWWRYVASADFGVDVAENWQSEFLQFWLYLSATVWLLQKGSPESTELDNAGKESDEDQKVKEHAEHDSPAWAGTGGWRTAVYSWRSGHPAGGGPPAWSFHRCP